MTYEEALKAVQKLKIEGHHLSLKFGYKTLVLPYKAGLKIIEALEYAEVLDNAYGGVPKLTGFTRHESVEITPMSAEEYRRYKMAELLNVTYTELARQEEEQATVPEPTF